VGFATLAKRIVFLVFIVGWEIFFIAVELGVVGTRKALCFLCGRCQGPTTGLSSSMSIVLGRW